MTIAFKTLFKGLTKEIKHRVGFGTEVNMFYIIVGLSTKRIEFILECNLLEKKCKTAILLYCFHTAQVYVTNLCYITFWARERHFIENLKLTLTENQIMK